MLHRLSALTILFLAIGSAWAEVPRLQWALSPPLFRLAKAADDEAANLVDPAVVRHEGKWHLFAGSPGGMLYYQLDDFKADGPKLRGKKVSAPGVGVPQVYFHRATKKWHMIGQLSSKDADAKTRFTPCISMNDKLDNAEGWSKPVKMEVETPLDEKEKPVRWMDFYVIFDDAKAHMFATSGGRLWRSETKAADFPQGWSKPVAAIKGSIVYASHTYRQETEKGFRYLTTLTASAPDPESKKNKQFQVSYVAEKLEGPWTPELVKWDDPFAGFGTLAKPDPRWSRDMVHGEPLRKGIDERMILERDVEGFVFHAKARLRNEADAPSIDCVGFLEGPRK